MELIYLLFKIWLIGFVVVMMFTINAVRFVKKEAPELYHRDMNELGGLRMFNGFVAVALIWPLSMPHFIYSFLTRNKGD